jgi:hypothetical protein
MARRTAARADCNVCDTQDALTRSFESLLDEGEQLTEFVEASVREDVQRQPVQAEFVAGGQQSCDEVSRTGESPRQAIDRPLMEVPNTTGCRQGVNAAGVADRSDNPQAECSSHSAPTKNFVMESTAYGECAVSRFFVGWSRCQSGASLEMHVVGLSLVFQPNRIQASHLEPLRQSHGLRLRRLLEHLLVGVAREAEQSLMPDATTARRTGRRRHKGRGPTLAQGCATTRRGHQSGPDEPIFSVAESGRGRPTKSVLNRRS